MNATLIEKIRRLRALSQSSSVQEAAAAAAAAERLIQEHQIAEAELDATTADDVAPVTETLDGLGAQFPLWKGFLSQVLEKGHGCAGYQATRDGKKVHITVGRPDDIATVRYLYAWLTAEITRLCEASGIEGRTARNSFRIGAVAGIKESMYAAREAVRSTATGAALVKIDARLDAAKSALPSNLRSARRSATRLDGSAYAAGKRAGASVHAGQRLGTGGERLLGR